MPNNEEGWKKLNFAQRMGAEPLPTMLQPTEITRGLRAALWAVVYTHLENHVEYNVLSEPWSSIFYRKFIFFDKRMIDEFDYAWDKQRDSLSSLFRTGDYLQVYGCLDFFLRDPQCPEDFAGQIQQALDHQLAPFVVTDGMLVPISSPEQRALLVDALEQLRVSPMGGASTQSKCARSLCARACSSKPTSDFRWYSPFLPGIFEVPNLERHIDPNSDSRDAA